MAEPFDLNKYIVDHWAWSTLWAIGLALVLGGVMALRGVKPIWCICVGIIIMADMGLYFSFIKIDRWMSGSASDTPQVGQPSASPVPIPAAVTPTFVLGQRIIPPEMRKAMVDVLFTYKGRRFRFFGIDEYEESVNLAAQYSRALVNCGWIVDETIKSIPIAGTSDGKTIIRGMPSSTGAFAAVYRNGADDASDWLCSFFPGIMACLPSPLVPRGEIVVVIYPEPSGLRPSPLIKFENAVTLRNLYQNPLQLDDGIPTDAINTDILSKSSGQKFSIFSPGGDIGGDDVSERLAWVFRKAEWQQVNGNFEHFDGTMGFGNVMVGVSSSDFASGNIPQAAHDLLAELKRADIAWSGANLVPFDSVPSQQIMIRIGLSPFTRPSRDFPPPDSPPEKYYTTIYPAQNGDQVIEILPATLRIQPCCIVVDISEKKFGNWQRAWIAPAQKPGDPIPLVNGGERATTINGRPAWGLFADNFVDKTQGFFVQFKKIPPKIWIGWGDKIGLINLLPGQPVSAGQ